MESELHFVLIPLMSPGHLLPMVDMARLLATHGITVSIVTTPLNTTRFVTVIDRAVASGLHIRLLHLQFPTTEFGLPEGCENMDQLPSRDLIKNYFMAAAELQERFEELFKELKPKPSCIVSGKNLPWTVQTAQKFNIPRIFFDGMGCFSFTCTHNIELSKTRESVSKFDSFVIPGLPHEIKLKKAQLPENLNKDSNDLKNVRDNMRATEHISDGIVVNTFEELETEYVKKYKKVKGDDKVYCIGPLSAINKLSSDKAERGSKRCCLDVKLKPWLDSREPGSVIYACLGSISGLTKWQLVELGLGLESSKKPFIWVIRENPKSNELENWISEEKFEDRLKDRGLIIRGWSPQLWILSHVAIGAFLTHCGWNSTTEAVSAGVPIIACPLFAEQFINERLVVDVLGIGVSIGVEEAVTWGLEEEFGLVMKRERVKMACEEVMEESDAGEERRRRAKRLGEIAIKSIEEGGSSHRDMELLIQFVLRRTKEVTQITS
ncbi:UDP-glycosyltransferase 73C4 [Hibiscus syriacus]|uniref:Glycosyltransferase n=1 Tax=Hibiscus syriacus TaxID=106335 RepID=A0A6A2YR83_HIBSY|nr:UDP-glycosyltransferase 73C3-like [Hibiscus syriacus]KAE8681873.1 UDP-glycosyltransferase 73C4 [Hibiscus syriacus]